MLKKLMARLGNDHGESLVESLVAVAIVSLAGLIIAGAVASSAKLNNRMNNRDGTEAGKIVTLMQYRGSADGSGVTVTLSGNILKNDGGNDIVRPADGTVELGTVNIFIDKGGMTYYEKAD